MMKRNHPVEFTTKSPLVWWFQPILQNISQIGSFPQVGMNKKKIFELQQNHLKQLQQNPIEPLHLQNVDQSFINYLTGPSITKLL